VKVTAKEDIHRESECREAADEDPFQGRSEIPAYAGGREKIGIVTERLEPSPFILANK
jgi:hypothetical protein